VHAFSILILGRCAAVFACSFGASNQIFDCKYGSEQLGDVALRTGGGDTLLIYRTMPRVWDICMYNQMIVSHRRHAKRILQRLSLLCAVAWLKEGTFAPSASVISDRCYPGRLRVRSGVDYCAPPRRSFPSPPLPPSPRHSRQPDRCCAFGVYVSDIPITLIQEVVGSHAIYGRNNVELAREYIVACRSRRLGIPRSTAGRVLRWFWIIRRRIKPGCQIFLLLFITRSFLKTEK